MLDHAFRWVDRVVFIVGERNIRSQRAVERLGARRRGLIHKLDSKGRPLTSIAFVIERPAPGG
jgi:N-acetyltransferase